MLTPNLHVFTCSLLKISHMPKGGPQQNIRPKMTTLLCTCCLWSHMSSQAKVSYFINGTTYSSPFSWEILDFLLFVFNRPFKPTYTEVDLQTHFVVSVFIAPRVYSRQVIITLYNSKTSSIYLGPIFKWLLGALSTFWFIIYTYLLVNMLLDPFKGLYNYSCWLLIPMPQF